MKKEQIQSQPRKATAPVLSGTIIDGRYRVEGEIGSGGMCVVYRATQLDLDRLVAVKMPLPRLRNNAKAVARFFNEATATARLHHRNIVEVYAVGQDEQVPYIAMELLDGISLAEFIAEQPEQRLTEEQALPLVLQLCDGLQYAHDAGLIHRDLKPSNIMLTGPDRDAVKIVDFGIATMVDELGAAIRNLTASGEVLGSVSYMSPEQCRSQTLDHRCDLYSLGCVIHEMLDGQPPYVGTTPYAVMMMKQSQGEFQLPKQLATSRFGCLLSALLQNDPARRPASAAPAKDLLLAPKFKSGWRTAKLLPVTAVCCLTVTVAVLVAGWQLHEVNALKQRETSDSLIVPLISNAIEEGESYPVEWTGPKSRQAKLAFADTKLQDITTHKREVVRLWTRLARAYPVQYASKEKLLAADRARAMLAKDPTLATADDPIQPQLLFSTAEAYNHLNQPDQALNYYLRYRAWLEAHGTKLRRDEWVVLNSNLGNLWFERHNWESAASCYLEVLRTTMSGQGKEVSHGDAIRCSERLVRCYLNLGRKSDAAQGLALQARLLMNHGDYPAALRAIDSAIALQEEPSFRQLRR